MRLLPLYRLTVVLLALLALAIQTLVVETHIHRGARPAPRASAIAVFADASVRPTTRASGQPKETLDRHTGSGDPSGCPLCQAVVLSGEFVQSAVSLAYVSAWVNVRSLLLQNILHPLAVCHPWRGRGPPSA